MSFVPVTAQHENSMKIAPATAFTRRFHYATPLHYAIRQSRKPAPFHEEKTAVKGWSGM
jgi:hypothetical protein